MFWMDLRTNSNFSLFNITQIDLVWITNKMHQVSKMLFCHETVHVSGIFCAHHQELSAVHVAIGMFHAGYVVAA